jgi:hypothetical protein
MGADPKIFNLKINCENFKKINSLFYNHPRYGIGNRIVEKIFQKYPENERMENVLIKVTMLNSIYSTAIFDIYGISKHIHNIDKVDRLLSDGDSAAVDKIRHGHGIGKEKERDLYSFSTKYCFFHNKEAFPIFDSKLSGLLREFNSNSKYKFYSKFTRQNLYDYKIYKDVIMQFRKCFNLTSLTCVEFDHAMWILGKYAYRKSDDKDYEWLTKELRGIIQ